MRLMKAERIAGRVRRRYRTTTLTENEQPLPPNLLDREFTADAPNKRWVVDTSELVTPTGRLFLAVIIDLYSRFVAGWALSAVNNRHLVLKALDMAIKRRGPARDLLHHSDQGSTYASEDYQAALKARGITCSMSRRGNCYDNAAMESWFSTVKSELGERFEDPADAKEKLFDYIEAFYNPERLHSALGYRSPAEFERTFPTPKAA
jgi:transposase InsO family protein